MWKLEPTLPWSLGAAIGSAFFLACVRSPACYELEFVNVDRVAKSGEGKLELIYHTLAETMFASPGVDLDRRDQRLEVRVLRVFYKDSGDPDVRACAGEPFQRRVTLDLGGAREVVLTDGKTRRTLWPEPAPGAN